MARERQEGAEFLKMVVRAVDLKPAGLSMLNGPSRPSPGVLTVRAVTTLSVISLILAALGRATGIEALALGGGYGVVFLGIGAAPFQLRANLDIYVRITGAVLVGFSALLIAGGLMADIRGLWDPVAAAVVLGVPTVVLHAVGVTRTRAISHLEASLAEALDRRYPGIVPAPAERTPGADERSSEADRPLPRDLSLNQLSIVLTIAGSALWLAAALVTRDPSPGYWGMLRTISPLWYCGLVIVLIGFALGRGAELPAALAAFSFALATVLTPALVYGAPREATAAKQMQLTQYVLVHHHFDVTAGIYPAFSSTFDGIGALSALLGIHGMLGHMSLWGLATYWPVLLAVMRVAELRLLAGRLVATTTRRWIAVMLVLLVDSLGTDYFSPQSIGYVMAVGMVALAVYGLNPLPLGRRATFWLLLVAGIALAPTHELSPYMAAGALLVLALFGQAPLWACLPIGVPALAWAAIVHKTIEQHFTFGALFNLGNFTPPVTVATPGLHRLAVVGVQSHVLLVSLLILILLGALGFLPNIRTRWAWAYGLCPIVGLAFIAINPYGNEGIFRATLFAIPWIAVLAMKMPEPGGGWRLLTSPAVVTAAVTSCLMVLLGTFLVAAYAMDGTMVLAAGDVAVVDHLMHLPGRNAFVLSIGSADNPADGANSIENYTPLEWSQVANVPELQQLHPPAVDATALADRYGLVAAQQGATPRSPLYLIWAHSSLLYANAYGLQSPPQMHAWLRLLETSPNWRLVDRARGTYLFKLV